MKKMNLFFSFCSTISAVIMLICLTYYQGLVGSWSLLGTPLFLGLCMFLNPIHNLYRGTKKIISNPIYQIGVFLFSLFCIQVTLQSIFLYYTLYSIDFGYEATLYFGDHYLVMGLGVLLLLLASCFFPKKEEINLDHSKLCFFVIALSSFAPFLGDFMGIKIALSIGVGIFSLVLFFQNQEFYPKEESQRLYFLLFLLCLFTNNSIALILVAHLYLQLDHTSATI